jgi:hypothetical protein
MTFASFTASLDHLAGVRDDATDRSTVSAD